MKRVVTVLMVLLLVVSFTSPAFAAAKMTVVNKSLITFEGDWKGYFFAKVENTGDAAGYLEYGGKLVGFNADDDIILTENYVGSYPSRMRLEPGEYAYIREYFLENALKTDTIADYKFSIKTEDRGSDYTKLPCEAKLEYSSASKYDNYINVTFTNTTESTLYGFAVTVAAFDQKGELVFVEGDSTSSIGVHPGSTLTLKLRIDSDLAEYFQRKDIKLTEVDAFVYVGE